MSVYDALVWRPWINHSSDLAAGWTVTIPANTGAYIVAALSVVVGMAGGAAWTMAAFALHQYRASRKPETGLTRMFQVILRNSSTSMGSALEIVQAGHAWSGSVSQAKTKAYCLALWPVMIKLIFTIASIFVAKVAIDAYEVNVIRLQPTNCGLDTITGSNSTTANYKYQWKHVNDIKQSRAYVDACYNSSNGSIGCNTLPVQSLPFTTNEEATCKFGDLCLKVANNAFELDTGVLNSQIHFGINAKEKDRVNFRVSTTCSPLSYKDYTTYVPDPDSNDNSTIFDINYGPIGNVTTYTWQYRNQLSFLNMPYTVQTILNYAGPYNSNKNGWIPIAPLNLTDADTSLVFVAANSVTYEAPVFDPLYAANGTYATNNSEDGRSWYISDRWFNIVGCADQIELCNPNGGSCSGFMGSLQSLPWIEGLGFSEAQKATALRLTQAHAVSHPEHVVDSLRASALLANDLLVLGTSSPGLPSTQWQKETTSWFQTTLANMQYRIVDFPTNAWASKQNPADWQTTGDTSYRVVAPRNWLDSYGPALDGQCKQQLVRSTDQYQSFRLVGVLIVVIVSFAIIVTSWTLELCVRNRKDRRPGGLKRHKLLAHIADGKTHLLYTALKDAGYRGWEDEMEALPHRRPADLSCPRDIAPIFEHGEGSVVFPGPQGEGPTSRGYVYDEKTPSAAAGLLGGHMRV